MPEKPEERDPEGSTQLIITLALEVLHLVSVISVALGFSSVKAGFYCLHHRILKWLFFLMIRVLIQNVIILMLR